jgi:hypothetical protein
MWTRNSLGRDKTSEPVEPLFPAARDTFPTALPILEALTNRVDALVARLRPQLEAYDTNMAQALTSQAQLLKKRIISRSTGLARHFDMIPR